MSSSVREENCDSYLVHDGIRIRKRTLEELRERKDYEKWMDVLAATRIMSFGPVPYDPKGECTKVHVEAGLRKKFGHCHHWWGKLRALFPPSGQVKNFLNAALVAGRVPNGGKLAIVGSRYSQGSGDWVKLLMHWLNNMGRRMTIHCFDPNEVSGTLTVGSVTAVAVSEAVVREKLGFYDGLVDDVYVPAIGYELDTKVNATYVSLKMPAAGVVAGRHYSEFLHSTEARYFNFDMDWQEYPTACSCQRCRIEGYLGITVYSDWLDPSPCRRHTPEVVSFSEQWNERTVGEVRELITPVDQRASIVMENVMHPPRVKRKDVKVDRIMGYSPDQVDIAAEPNANPWQSVCPTVVVRPGALVSQVAKKVSRHLEKGWCPEAKFDEWTVYRRPEPRVMLPAGKARVFWGDVEVERYRRVVQIDASTRIDVVGKMDVKQWCFRHRCQDDCGLVTDFLDFPLCECGHRHGAYSLRSFGVECGTVSLTPYSVFQDFISRTRPVVARPNDLAEIVKVAKGDPNVIEGLLASPHWMEMLRPPDFFFIEGRWYHYPWVEILRRIGKKRLKYLRFLKVMADLDLPWPDMIFRHLSSHLVEERGYVRAVH